MATGGDRDQQEQQAQLDRPETGDERQDVIDVTERITEDRDRIAARRAALADTRKRAAG